MGGGQPGDRGVLRLADGGEIQIVDTRKGESLDDIVHIPAEGTALPGPGTEARSGDRLDPGATA